MANSSITLTQLKKHLKDASKEDLIEDIAVLFKSQPAVKDYFALKLNPEGGSAIAESYKKKIENEFFPTRGLGRARLSIARKAVNDFKKVCTMPIAVADIMVFYVEQGVRFTREYGDINESFYNSMESMYDEALKLICRCKLQAEFEERCRGIVDDTSGMGWGFHDGLKDRFEEAFE
jgi:hypothetical protein